MIQTTRRDFFRNIFLAGAALTTSATGGVGRSAEAAERGEIKGMCLYVPTLGKAGEFVELMNKSAPGEWQVRPLEGSLNDRYFRAKELYSQARGKVNTFVGVVDPATFHMVREAVLSGGGSFHYVTYEERNRVTFSARL